MKDRGRKQASLSCSSHAGRAAEQPASRRTTPSTGASTNRPIDAMIPWAPGASDHEVDRVFFRERDMRPNPRRSTGRPDARHDGRAKQPGAWTATRRGAVALALVSWLAVLGCQTARPPAPVTSPTSTPPEAFPLAGMVWLADEIDGQRVVDGIASTIAFDGRSQAVGSTGCNRYVAPFHVAGSTLRLGDIAMTRRACPPASHGPGAPVRRGARGNPNLPSGRRRSLAPGRDRTRAPASHPNPGERLRPGESRQGAPSADFAFTKQPATIEVSAMGPLQLTYVNPADDPSKK